MEKKEVIQYAVEREFLSKFSVEELIIRIIRSHLAEQKGPSKSECTMERYMSRE